MMKQRLNFSRLCVQYTCIQQLSLSSPQPASTTPTPSFSHYSSSRSYASTASSTSSHNANNQNNNDLLLNWPTIECPTPYEIFHLSWSETVDKKLLKSHFHRLAKVYHPDSLSSSLSTSDPKNTKSNNNNGFASFKSSSLKNDKRSGTVYKNAAGQSSEPDLRAERFKLIVAAYNILKDDFKRKEYDMYNKGWATQRRSSATYSGTAGSQAGPRSTYAYHGRDFSRGTKFKTDFTDQDDPWASYHSDYRDHMRRQDPEYHRQQWETHKKMVYLLSFGSFVVAIIQFGWLSRRAQKDQVYRNKESKKALDNVYMATSNYGYGEGKQDRIDRFLAQRKESLYNEMENEQGEEGFGNGGENRKSGYGNSPFALANVVPGRRRVQKGLSNESGGKEQVDQDTH